MAIDEGQYEISVSFLKEEKKKLNKITLFYSLITSLDLGVRLWFSVNSKPGGKPRHSPKIRGQAGRRLGSGNDHQTGIWSVKTDAYQNEIVERRFNTMTNKNRKLPQILTAAAIMAAVSAVPAFAASGWNQENGEWVYLDRNGDRVTNVWKKNAAGNHWFYLDEDGYMVTNQLVEDNDQYYYVNEDGAMVKNEWRKLEDDSDNDAYTDGTCWYYFGSNGKATKNTSGRTKLSTINGKKYVFDEEGKMLFGWINEENAMVNEAEEWSSGVFYCGEEDDGAAVINKWSLLEVDDPEGDSDADGNYWFYFSSNGKKFADVTKKINGKSYQFDERGVAQFKWYMASPSSIASSSTASSSDYKFYNSPEECWRAEGWFYTVPTQDIDEEAYEDDQAYWFYANKNGSLVTSQLKTINNYKYGFNEKGEMLEGLYALTFDGGQIESYEKINNIDEMPDAEEGVKVYYFGNSPKDGVMATKKSVKVELDDDQYDFGFRTNGEAIHGISDNKIYIMGRMMKADSDMKYGEITFEGNTYLINTSGTIQKKKNNVKDSNDTYYCTDEKGIITYRGSEKK